MKIKPKLLQLIWTKRDQGRLPYWVFPGILFLMMLFYLFPVDLRGKFSGPTRGPESLRPPTLFVYPIDLPSAGARCPNSCIINVCTRWVPEGHAQCPVGGPGGGCCLSYGQECDPACQEDDPYQPPTINASQSCSLIGNGNWCIGDSTFDLIASDPQGQTVLISGDVSGTAFACTNGATSCAVPLPEGSGVVNYLVTSATGLTASGSQTYQRDTSVPQITGNLSGSNGGNGWFVSPVQISATASDTISGVTNFSYSQNGGGWSSFGSPFTISDGIHAIEFQAVDAAGNQSMWSQTVKIDTTAPILDLEMSGMSALHGWYRSEVQVTTSANDPGSGMAAIQYTLDGNNWTTYTSPLLFMDGSHSLSVRAMDAAGNLTQTEQLINVDTVTPLISLSIAGTAGTGGWYISDTQVSATGSDLGSGIESLEYSLENGVWTTYSTPLIFKEGKTGVRFRATDYAGNVTTTPAQLVWVDTTSPTIDMLDSWKLGASPDYEVLDDESGVTNVRMVIQDDLERWPKVSWYDAATSEIAWDGRFADGTRAPDGEYFVSIKASDAAGNQAEKTGVIIVENNLLSLLLPPFNPPSITPAAVPQSVLPSSEESYGGEANDDPFVPHIETISLGGAKSSAGVVARLSFGNQPPAISTAASSPGSGILWGALAAAAVGAFTAEILRKKQEEGEKAGQTGERKGPSGYLRKMRAQKLAEVNAEGLERATTEEATRNAPGEARALGKELIIESQTRAYSVKPQELIKGEPISRSQSADTARWTGLVELEQAKAAAGQQKTWWEKTLDVIDQNQVAVSIAIGVTLGLTAIVLTGGAATPLVAAAWIAGGTALAGGSVALGTVALNAYYERPLGENVLKNLTYAAGAAAVTGTVAYVLVGGGGPYVATTLTRVCGQYVIYCAGFDVVLKAVDYVEQYQLAAKAMFQEWRGDTQGAQETVLELQMEYQDGGIPGNTMLKEASENLVKVSEAAGKLFQLHGIEIVAYLTKYGDDAIDFINVYGLDGLDLLHAHGEDALSLFRKYGDNAIRYLRDGGEAAVLQIKKLETILDGPALEYAMLQGPDAVKAVTYWNDELLELHGMELSLRAAADARALRAASELARLDDLNGTEAQGLIRIIAENSMQGNGNRYILGKWIPNDLDEGFIGVARAEEAGFYGPNPGLEEVLDGLSIQERDEIFWSINEQAILEMSNSSPKIEYSLEGISNTISERAAIEAIAQGNIDLAMRELGLRPGIDALPFRMREINLLVEQGYTFVFDEKLQVYHWTKP